MSNWKNAISILILLAILTSFLPMAIAIPETVTIQGKLTNSNGQALTGDYTFLFELFDSNTGGTTLWTETHGISVSNGIFSANMGSNNTTQYLTTADFNAERWIQISVDGTAQVPRIKMNSQPSAFIAKKTMGIDLNAFMQFSDFNSWYASTFAPNFTGDSNFVNVGVSGSSFLNDDVVLTQGKKVKFAPDGLTWIADVSNDFVITNSNNEKDIYFTVKDDGESGEEYVLSVFGQNYGIGFGVGAAATGLGSAAIGSRTTASGERGVVIGYDYTNAGDFEIHMAPNNALVQKITTSGVDITGTLGVSADSNFANIGLTGGVYGDSSTVFFGDKFQCENCTASGDDASAIGDGTTASGADSFATGYKTTASGTGSLSGGYFNAVGGEIAAEGAGSRVSGYISGPGTGILSSAGIGSLAFGMIGLGIDSKGFLQSAGTGSLAGGYVNSSANITSWGTGSVALGYSDANLSTTGVGAIALGYNVQSLEEASVTLGKNLTNYNANSVLVNDLNVTGDFNTSTGYTGDISVRKGDDSGACLIKVSNGIITGTTC